MKQKKMTWLKRFAGIFNPTRDQHRICRLCHKRILRAHKWHSVKVGWFAPWYCCEHRDCSNPMKAASKKPNQTLELPFETEIRTFTKDGTSGELKIVNGALTEVTLINSKIC
jgi:hypothetical protein